MYGCFIPPMAPRNEQGLKHWDISSKYRILEVAEAKLATDFRLEDFSPKNWKILVIYRWSFGKKPKYCQKNQKWGARLLGGDFSSKNHWWIADFLKKMGNFLVIYHQFYEKLVIFMKSCQYFGWLFKKSNFLFYFMII